MLQEKRTKQFILETMESLNKHSNGNKEVKAEASLYLNTSVEIGHKIFCYLPVKMLKVDSVYQRPLQSTIKDIVKNWDDERCEPIVVNYRNDGYFYVINGQHRTEAARQLGIPQLVCDVFAGLSIKEEADLFSTQYEGSTKLSPIDSYRSNIVRGEKIDTLIKEICDKYGVIVSDEKAPKVLGSLTVIRRIVTPNKKSNRTPEENLQIVEWIFDIFKKCGWEDYRDTYNADMMQSLWYVWRNNQDSLHTVKAKLIKHFSKTSPKDIKSLGNFRYPDCGHGSGVYRVMMDIINDKEKIANVEKYAIKIAN